MADKEKLFEIAEQLTPIRQKARGLRDLLRILDKATEDEDLNFADGIYELVLLAEGLADRIDEVLALASGETPTNDDLPFG